MEVEDLPLVDPMVIDPWWWQGVVTFEYTPEAMDMDAPVEGGLGDADLDQPAQVMGDVEMEENSDPVAFEDVLMEDASIEAEPIVQDNIEAEVHSDRGVEPQLHVADAREEALVPEGDRSVVSSAPKSREEGDVVLNRGASVDFPTLPLTEVLNESSSKVLSQAPVENQGSSEDRSGSAESSHSVEQHPAGCQCASCAAVAIDLEEVRRFFDQFEEEEEEDEEEQEWAQEEDRVLRNRTGGRSRLLGPR
jgi:hypothetical protein